MTKSAQIDGIAGSVMPDLSPTLHVRGIFSRCEMFSCWLRFSTPVTAETIGGVQEVMTPFALALHRGSFGANRCGNPGQLQCGSDFTQLTKGAVLDKQPI